MDATGRSLLWSLRLSPRLNPNQLGSKEIFHLEAFVAKFMSVYKRFILDLQLDF